MNDERKSIPDWQLERLALGELDEATAREVRRKLAGDPDAQARFDGLAASNEQILRRLPPEIVGAAIQRRLDEQKTVRAPRPRRWLATVPLAMVGAAGLVFVALRPHGPAPVDQSTPEVIRTKGDTRLVAYRARVGEKPVRLTPSARVRAHDVLQLAYATPESRYGVVVSIDGRGGVTQHLPVGGETPAALSPKGEVNLPQSYELDDAPGFERFFFVTAPAAFSLSDVMDAARALARRPDEARSKSLALAPGLTQQSLLLEKVQP